MTGRSLLRLVHAVWLTVLALGLALVIGAWAASLDRIVAETSHKVSRLTRITLALLPGRGPDQDLRASLILGARDLAHVGHQRPGEKEFNPALIRIGHTPGQGWYFQNASQSDGIVIRYQAPKPASSRPDQQSVSTQFTSARDAVRLTTSMWPLSQGDIHVITQGASGPIETTLKQHDEQGDRSVDIVLAPAGSQSAPDTINLKVTPWGVSAMTRNGHPVTDHCPPASWFDWIAFLEDLNGWARHQAGLTRTTTPVTLGGAVTCLGHGEPSRIAILGLKSSTLALIQDRNHDLHLAPGRSTDPAAQRSALAAVVEQNGTSARLVTRPWPLLSPDPASGQVDRLTIGRATYTVQADQKQLKLVAVEGRALLRSEAEKGMFQHCTSAADPDPTITASVGSTPADGIAFSSQVECARLEPPLTSAMAWVRGHAGRIVIGAGIVATLAAIAAGVGAGSRNTPAAIFGWGAFLAGVVVPVSGLASGVLAAVQWPETAQRFGLAFDDATSLLALVVLWSAASLLVLARLAGPWAGLGVLIWLGVTVLVAIGHVELAQMGYGSENERWISYFRRTTPPLAILAAAVTCALWVSTRWWQVQIAGAAYSQWHRPLAQGPLGTRWTSSARLLFTKQWRQVQKARFPRRAPIVLAVIFVFLWTVFGTDEGIGGIVQPSEYLKFATVYITSLVMVTAYSNLVSIGGERHIGRLMALAGGIVVLLGVMWFIPVLRHDFSPLLIMLLTTASIGLFASIAGVAAILGSARFALMILLAALVMFGVGLARSQFDLRLQLANGACGLVALSLLAGLNHRRAPAPPPVLFGFRDKPRWPYDWRVSWSAPLHRNTVVVLVVSGWRALIRNLFFVVSGVIGLAVILTAYGLLSWDASTRDAKLKQADAARGLAMTKFHSRVLTFVDFDLRQSRLTPLIYPDEGRQLLLSRGAIARAPCKPPALSVSIPFLGPVLENGARQLTDALAKLVCPENKIATAAAPLGYPNDERLHQIPVVKSDFIGSFLIGRFGTVTAAIVLIIQTMLVVVAAVIGFATFLSGRGREADRARQHLLGLMCLGSAVVLALQWAAAWGNVFGLLPIMGQPMTFLAFSGSHLIWCALPMLLVFFTAIRLERAVVPSASGPVPPVLERSVARQFKSFIAGQWRAAFRY